MPFYVYILTNKSYTLYVGSSKNLPRRVNDHKRKKSKSGFTAKYNIDKLIYFKEFERQNTALGVALNSHLIVDLTSFGLDTDNFKVFIDKRSEAIATHINALLQALK